MSFVFQASQLPFSNISEAYASAICPLLAVYPLTDLTLWDRCLLAAVLPVVTQYHTPHFTTATAAALPSHEAVSVSLRVVRALEELEVAYDIACEAGERHRCRPGEPSASARICAGRKTAEEILMAELLRERCDGTLPALLDDNSDVERGEDETLPDIAMCFDTEGESIGMGSVGVFGGHGYHEADAVR